MKEIDKYSSQKLCEIVASSRYLGALKEEAILCMQELSRRRTSGDNFDFETEIDKIKGNLPDFKDMQFTVDLNAFKGVK